MQFIRVVIGDSEQRMHEAAVTHVKLWGFHHRWAVEIKRGLAPGPEKGFYFAREDLKPERSFVVYSGKERYPLMEGVEAIGLAELMALLAEGH